MIYFYIFSIVIVAFAIIVFFAIRKDRQQKKLDDYRREKLKKDDEAFKMEQAKKTEKVADETAEKSETKIEIQSDALENFVLEKPVAIKAEASQVEDEQDDEDEETKSFEESFAEYERFLKENNIDLDDLEEDDEDEKEEPKNEITINLKDFEGKSRAEIMEILSNYTEEEQKLILEELMGRKDN